MVSTESTASDDDPSSILNVNVGVLGHVDSGKTSLVKTLSTFLSTAALDKSKQSRQRGMTLDLGFSCFVVDMPAHLEGYEQSRLQMTLVDCPGHASLIRTIIGGAQIIDMVLLVVDAFKGWQAQTTECLVLAELTSPKLVVALNKVDLFDEQEREAKLEQAKQDVRERLKNTRFADAVLVGVSACVGGEKVAAVASGGDASSGSALHSGVNETYNVDTLVRVLKQELPPPKRTREGPFYFSIDHCFPIRGQGTVLTGTVLNGSAATNSMIEFPTLGLERKIKSIQMFRRKVGSIRQGDRAGVCVSNLDAKLLERGVAATPGAVQLLRGALALVRKVPYYQGTLPCGAKFHISVGHTTVMATVTFWGASELAAAEQTHSQTIEEEHSQEKGSSSKRKNEQLRGHSSLGGDADMAGLPKLTFDFNQDFVQQDRLLESVDDKSDCSPLLHWALLDFQTPVYCPLDSLVIGSRLDAVDNSKNTASSALGGAASSCRLAFSGRLVEKMDPSKDFDKVRLYTPKERRGVIRRLGDPHRREDDQRIVRYEVFGTDLFKKETNMKLFVGMKLVTDRGEVGVIKSSFGTTGKFRVYFPGGTEAREGDALLLQFKRYAHDEKKEMHQDLELPPSRPGARLENEKKKKDKGGAKQQGSTKNKISPSAAAAAPAEESAQSTNVVGEITLLKGDVLENGKHPMAIVGGFFTPEVDIREKKGTKVVVTSTEEEGVIAGPFGKAGKCKVSFEDGVSAEVGAKAELIG